MGDLLDKFPFATFTWDKGAMGFRRSDRRRGRLAQTLKEWHPKSFKNPIIQIVWDAFPGMEMWCIWKERNARIFKDQRSDAEMVWKTVKDNLLSCIQSM